MQVFDQPIRIEQQLCSIARFGWRKISREFEKRRCYDDAQNFFDKDATKLNETKRTKCSKVTRIKQEISYEAHKW